MKQWIRWIVLAVVLVLLGSWAWRRWFVTEETRIRRTIGAMEQAVEKGSLLRLEGHVAADYADDNGLDKQTLLGTVRAFRQRYDTLFIHITDLTITLDPDGQTAQATLIAKVIAVATGGAETEIRAERVRLHLRKTDAGWRLYRSESPELKFD